ncbi:MAG TPA: O-antigen ligase family protein [Gammaproteobacteria bacterium]|nr:O-antigen ligase family protein [Gammaproteobacteria bacterium]
MSAVPPNPDAGGRAPGKIIARWRRLAFPSVPATGPSGAVGLLGLFFLSVGLASSLAAQNIGVGLMLLALLWNGRRAWRDLWPNPVFRFMLLWLGYLIALAIWAALEVPVPAGAQLEGLRFYGRILYVPLVGWWIGRDARSIRSVALLVLVGLLIAVGMHVDWHQPFASLHLTDGSASNRSGFGLNPEHMGLIAVSAVFGLVAFVRGWIGSLRQPRWLLGLRSLAWLALVVLAFQVLIVSGTRADWLAGLVVGLVGAAVFVWRQLRGGGWVPAALVVAGVLAVGVGVGANLQGVTARMTGDSGTFAKILHGQYSQIHSADIGSRLDLWRWGIREWTQRPVFGWGPGSRKPMLVRSDVPKYVTSHLKHLHNTYLELLFGQGVVGFLLFAGLWGLLAARVQRRIAERAIPPTMGWLLLSLLAVFALASGVESYVVVQLGWSYMALLGGAMFALGQNDGPAHLSRPVNERTSAVG